MWQSYNIFVKYYARGTTTSVNIGYDHLEFPSVTFCNMNPVKMNAVARELGRDSELFQFFEDIKPRTDFKRAFRRRKVSGWSMDGNCPA